MDELKEYIIPILFFIVWGVAKALSGQKSEEDPQNLPPQKRKKDLYETILKAPVPQKQSSKSTLPQLITEEEHAAILRTEEALAKINELNTARNTIESSEDPVVIKKASTPQNTQSIKALLKTSNNLKNAFVLHEILSTPVGLRDPQKSNQI